MRDLNCSKGNRDDRGQNSLTLEGERTGVHRGRPGASVDGSEAGRGHPAQATQGAEVSLGGRAQVDQPGQVPLPHARGRPRDRKRGVSERQRSCLMTVEVTPALRTPDSPQVGHTAAEPTRGLVSELEGCSGGTEARARIETGFCSPFTSEGPQTHPSLHLRLPPVFISSKIGNNSIM